MGLKSVKINWVSHTTHILWSDIVWVRKRNILCLYVVCFCAVASITQHILCIGSDLRIGYTAVNCWGPRPNDVHWRYFWLCFLPNESLQWTFGARELLHFIVGPSVVIALLMIALWKWSPYGNVLHLHWSPLPFVSLFAANIPQFLHHWHAGRRPLCMPKLIAKTGAVKFSFL